MLRASRSAGLLACVLLWASARALHAQPARQELHVAVRDDACPNAGQVEEALAPLLDQGAVLVLEATASTTRRASVLDRGEQYAVEIDGERRDLTDPRRDCVERARVAAVFIALNMRAEVKPAPPPAPEPQPEREQRAAPGPGLLPPGPGIAAFALGEHSTDAERSTLGGGLAVFYALAPLRFELSAAALAPVELELTPREDVRGRANVLRVPFALSVSYSFELGALELGPALGLALDVMHIEGQGVERPQSGLRLNPGALLAGEAQLWITPRVGLLARAQMRAFPRAYRLTVEPTGRLGETPQIWLGAQLGVQARL